MRWINHQRDDDQQRIDRFSRNQNRQCLFSDETLNVEFRFGQHLADIDEISNDRHRQVDGLMHVELRRKETRSKKY